MRRPRFVGDKRIAMLGVDDHFDVLLSSFADIEDHFDFLDQIVIFPEFRGLLLGMLLKGGRHFHVPAGYIIFTCFSFRLDHRQQISGLSHRRAPSLRAEHCTATAAPERPQFQ